MKAEATLVPFGILEMHWNGTLLDTIDKAPQWAKTMTWKGTRPMVQLLDQVYRTGARLTQAALKPFEQRLHRSETLSKWSAVIFPQPVFCNTRPDCAPPHLGMDHFVGLNGRFFSSGCLTTTLSSWSNERRRS